MIINKLEPFFTDEDKAKLSEIDLMEDDLLSSAGALTAKISQNQSPWIFTPSLAAESKQIWIDQYNNLMANRDLIFAEIDMRYTLSFEGNPALILDDVKEIVNAIEKKDYLEWQKRQSDSLKPMLNSFSKELETKGKESISDADKLNHTYLKAVTTKGYVNCCYFIMDAISSQIRALNYYNDNNSIKAALDISEEKAAIFYKKPKSSIKRPRRLIQEPIEPEDFKINGKLLQYPTSPLLNLTNDLLLLGAESTEDELKAKIKMKRKYNRNILTGADDVKIPIGKDETILQRNMRYESDTFKGTVSLNLDKLTVRNPQAKKLLVRTLLYAVKQSIRDSKQFKDSITFPLKELIGTGQYRNMDTARKGFKKSLSILMGLQFEGNMKIGKNEIASERLVLFPGGRIINGICEIDLNNKFNWGLIARFFTGLPDYYFELPDRAAELLEYIFYLARQNTKHIAEDGFFYISFRAIQYRLNIPNEMDDNQPRKNPGRDIKDAIENAIEQIEEAYAKYSAKTGDPEFSLLLIRDYDAPIKKYLDEGKLKVSLKGNYAKDFLEISHKTSLKIEENEKFQKKILENALTKNLEKHIETKNSTE